MKRIIIDPQLFTEPPPLCHPGYFWMQDRPLDDIQTVEPLRLMYEAGAKNACPHPMPKQFRPDTNHSTLAPEYLTEDYFRAFARIYDTASELKMHCFLYDEGGWPSGSACGKVMASDPERFACRYVVPDGNGGYEIRKKDNDLSANPPFPNLLMKEVTEKFLELTHEGYARYISRHFGKCCCYTFTDEPGFINPAGGLPWVDDLPQEFFRRKGYDIMPLLGRIINDHSRFPTALTWHKLDYLDVISRLYVERFLEPVRKWCHDHKLLSGGHFNNEDTPENAANHTYGHILRSLRALDLPGVDVIWQQLYPGRRKRAFPRFASSAAHQNGSKFALGEVFAIYGYALTPAVIRWVTDYMIVRGVNMLVVSSFGREPRGGEVMGRRFGTHHPLWKYMDVFHHYTARSSWLSTLGKTVISTAVYFDANSFWAGGITAENAKDIQEDIVRKLDEKRHNFDFIDDDLLLSGTVRRRSLCCGKMSYRTLIVPGCAMLPEAVKQRLAVLRDAGIRIITEDDVFSLPPQLKCFPETDALRVQKRKLASGILYFVVNETMSPVDVTLESPEKQPVIYCDAESGTLRKLSGRDGRWRWSFAPGSSAWFLLGEQPAAAAGRSLRKAEVLAGSWKLAPVVEYRLKDEAYCQISRSDVPCEVELGDWRQYLGEEFSGDARYTLEFECDAPDKWQTVSLGKVNYAATVMFNGTMLGKRLWGPYEFDLNGSLRAGKNCLEVIVTNTLSNAVHPDRVLQEWASKWKISCYEPITRAFEADTLESGLFGPVVLK